jgi:hypothetical protein
MAGSTGMSTDRSVEVDDPGVTIEMGGANIVIRSSAAIDRACTDALAHAVNSAVRTRSVIVIDPEQVPCDDAVTASTVPVSEIICPDHDECRPEDVEAIGEGVLRIAGEQTSWTIDVGAGRFCRSDRVVDVHFIEPAAWTPMVAVWITPTKISALTTGGSRISGTRAHKTAG